MQTKEDGAFYQEATADIKNVSSKEAIAIYTDEKVAVKHYEEDFLGAGVTSGDVTPEEDFISLADSEQEGSVSGEEKDDEEEDEGTGNFSMSVHYLFCDDNEEDRIFAEGQPLAPEGTGNPQVRNKEHGESEEEVSYFGSVPERGSEMMVKGDGIEEDMQEKEEKKQEDSSDSECEDTTNEREEKVFTHCFEEKAENSDRDGPAKASLEFPEISVENLQDLIAEIDTEENVEKVKDFSGEEHQEAGESFAEYPSDFSSCEYVEGEGKNQERYYQLNASPCISDLSSNVRKNTCLGIPVTDIAWMGRAEDADEEGGGYLYSRDIEMDTERLMSPGLATGQTHGGIIEMVENLVGVAVAAGCNDGGETDESDIHSSSDEEVQARRIYDEFSDHISLQAPQNNKELEDTWFDSGSSAASSIDHHATSSHNRPVTTSFSFTSDHNVFTNNNPDLSTAGDTDEAEIFSSAVPQLPAAEVNSYSAVQRTDDSTTRPSKQGSLDDSFFFNTEPEASGISEMVQLVDDEYEEERSWEQEQERIKAFHKFYDDSNEQNGREGECK